MNFVHQETLQGTNFMLEAYYWQLQNTNTANLVKNIKVREVDVPPLPLKQNRWHCKLYILQRTHCIIESNIFCNSFLS